MLDKKKKKSFVKVFLILMNHSSHKIKEKVSLSRALFQVTW